LDDNQVRLQLFALAYNLGNFLRRLALPASVKHWTLTTLGNKLIKIGCKVVHHARRVVFQLAQVAAPRQLFAAILRRIEGLRVLAPAPPHDHDRGTLRHPEPQQPGRYRYVVV